MMTQKSALYDTAEMDCLSYINFRPSLRKRFRIKMETAVSTNTLPIQYRSISPQALPMVIVHRLLHTPAHK